MKTNTIALLLLSIALLTGCTSEDANNEIPDPSQNGDKNVTLEVRIPGARTPSTYGMTAGQENQVSQLTVLAYKDVSGTEQLQQKIVATSSDITSSGTNNENVKVTLSIPAGDYSRLVVVANANSQVGALADDSPISELNAIEYTHASGQWDTATPDYIPMTGEVIAGTTNGISIRQGQTFSGLNLVRMLARVDIVNSAAATFTLKDVMLYNFNKNGLLVNDDTQYGASPAQPNLPGAVQNATSPITYTGAAVSANMAGEIYAFEAAAPTTATISTQTAPRIIIRGTYNLVDYYYPVDFTYDGSVSGTTKGDFMPIVRNHRYTFTVSQVSGPGFATAAAALASTDVITNIDVQVFVIDENVTDVYWDAKNYLAVNAPDFSFGYEEVTDASTDNKITVKSTAAWTISCFEADGTTAPDGGWLSVDDPGGDANTMETVSVLLQENTGAAREGKIKIQSGNFTHVVTVTQSGDDRVKIDVGTIYGTGVGSFTISTALDPTPLPPGSYVPAGSVVYITATEANVNAMSFTILNDTLIDIYAPKYHIEFVPVDSRTFRLVDEPGRVTNPAVAAYEGYDYTYDDIPSPGFWTNTSAGGTYYWTIRPGRETKIVNGYKIGVLHRAVGKSSWTGLALDYVIITER
ncbi:BACON domain-containing protein [Dysgonomonas termitidis]